MRDVADEMIRPGARRGAVLEIAGRPLCPVYDIVNESWMVREMQQANKNFVGRSSDHTRRQARQPRRGQDGVISS